VEAKRIPELYDLKARAGKIPVPHGARAYQVQNFKVISGPDPTPPAPSLHIEPLFFDATTKNVDGEELITEL
jgi:hypothetical protein